MLDLQELANWPEYVKVFVGVFALVPPPIVIPLFLGVMAARSVEEKKAAAGVAAIAFAVTMGVFTFLGDAILAVFGITLAAFRLAGGFLLLLIALDMIRSNPHADIGDDGKPSSSVLALGIVPITIPILAGPGAISAVVLFASDHEGISHRIVVSSVLVAVALTIFVMLRLAAVSDRLFTESTTVVFNKVMGLIVAAIAFEFVMDGIAGHFPQLTTIH